MKVTMYSVKIKDLISRQMVEYLSDPVVFFATAEQTTLPLGNTRGGVTGESLKVVCCHFN